VGRVKLKPLSDNRACPCKSWHAAAQLPQRMHVRVSAVDVSRPAPEAFRRSITVFTREDDGRYRRDEEVHDNVYLPTAQVPPLLARHGVDATLGTSFGSETLPEGLMTVIGTRR